MLSKKIAASSLVIKQSVTDNRHDSNNN